MARSYSLSPFTLNHSLQENSTAHLNRHLIHTGSRPLSLYVQCTNYPSLQTPCSYDYIYCEASIVFYWPVLRICLAIRRGAGLFMLSIVNFSIPQFLLKLFAAIWVSYLRLASCLTLRTSSKLVQSCNVLLQPTAH